MAKEKSYAKLHKMARKIEKALDEKNPKLSHLASKLASALYCHSLGEGSNTLRDWPCPRN